MNFDKALAQWGRLHDELLDWFMLLGNDGEITKEVAQILVELSEKETEAGQLVHTPTYIGGFLDMINRAKKVLKE